jgi:hypothetical protein
MRRRASSWLSSALAPRLALTGLGLALAAGAAAAAATAAGPVAAGPAAAPVEATGDARAKAEALFTRYIDLEHAFDPAQAELYSDTARIERRIVVPGQQRPVVRRWSGAQYKPILRSALQKAREKKEDLSYYSAISYLREGGRVRIKALRYAKPQKAVTPLELLVGPDAGGAWRIFAELSESHPLGAAQPPKT